MQRTLSVSLCVLMVAAAGWAKSDDCEKPEERTVSLDSHPDGGDFDFDVNSGCYRVRFVDLLDGQEYRISSAVTHEPEEPLGLFAKSAPGDPDRTSPSYILQPGDTLKVTLTESDGAGDPTEWTVSLTVERPWAWTASYGFMFLPNEDERFFQAPNPDGEGFLLREKDDNLDFDFAAAVMYTCHKRKPDTWWKSFGFTGGLGFDLSDPIVFAGVTWPAATNIGIHAGVVMHKQQRLRGEYDRDSVTTDQLSEDQLHEGTYEPNWYVGLSFRFDKAPDTHKAKK